MNALQKQVTMKQCNKEQQRGVEEKQKMNALQKQVTMKQCYKHNKEQKQGGRSGR